VLVYHLVKVLTVTPIEEFDTLFFAAMRRDAILLLRAVHYMKPDRQRHMAGLTNLIIARQMAERLADAADDFDTAIEELSAGNHEKWRYIRPACGCADPDCHAAEFAVMWGAAEPSMSLPTLLGGRVPEEWRRIKHTSYDPTAGEDIH
jgi:hypothetical protein